MKLFEAISVAHHLKDRPLEVHSFGPFSFYDQEEDAGLQQYLTALETIRKHRLLYWLLWHLRLI